MKIACTTRFDITATGVRNHFARQRMPFTDDAGAVISTESQWHRSRNQQRNWETVNQVISLRSLPFNITVPSAESHVDVKYWTFEFEIERAGEFDIGGDPLAALVSDCTGVPMIIGLDEDPDIEPVLKPGVNINFEILNS